MFCKNCGNQMDNLAAVCPRCGVARDNGYNYCPNCGAQTMPNQPGCNNCGIAFIPSYPGVSRKSKIAAGLLGIFLGSFGVHNFYLGYTTRGIIQIILTVCSCGLGGLWGFIEGIMILAGSINVDAQGIPLQD